MLGKNEPTALFEFLRLGQHQEIIDVLGDQEISETFENCGIRP